MIETWNEEPSRSCAPRIIDCTLAQFDTLPGERQLAGWLSLLEGFGVHTVAVGSVRHLQDWHRVERLLQVADRFKEPPCLEFNLDYPACGTPSLLSERGIRCRLLAMASNAESHLRSVCRHNPGGVTLVLHEAVELHPLELSRWVQLSQNCGVDRLEILSKQGRPWLPGVEDLVRFAQGLAEPGGLEFVWSSYDSLGLALAQALQAWEAGVQAIRGCVGGRLGSVPLEALWFQLHQQKLLDVPLERCAELTRFLEQEWEMELSVHHPLLGPDVFCSAGVAGSAVCQALEAGQPQVAESVYSAVPASAVGRKLEIAVGPCSRPAHVRHWLRSHELSQSPEWVDGLLQRAQQSPEVLSDLELVDMVDLLSDG